MVDVAIIGIGIHPFGRTDGVTGLEQGVFAARQALKDAGLEWSDMNFAYGGSAAAGAADTMVSKLGLTGLQFINVSNGCATGGSALQSAYMAIKSGMFDIGMAVGFDKHPRGAFTVDTQNGGLGKWYGDIGMALTPQFFGMKIQRYMYDYGITEDTLVRVAVKNYRNGTLNPNAWRQRRAQLRRRCDVADGLPSAAQVHVLLSRRRRLRDDSMPRRQSERAGQKAGVPQSG